MDRYGSELGTGFARPPKKFPGSARPHRRAGYAGHFDRWIFRPDPGTESSVLRLAHATEKPPSANRSPSLWSSSARRSCTRIRPVS